MNAPSTINKIFNKYKIINCKNKNIIEYNNMPKKINLKIEKISICFFLPKIN